MILLNIVKHKFGRVLDENPIGQPERISFNKKLKKRRNEK